MNSFKNKNILVPTDYSPCAMNALIYAAEFAQNIESKLVVFNSYQLPIEDTYFGGKSIDIIQELREESKVEMEKVIQLLNKKYPKVKKEEYVEYGSFGEVVEPFMKEKNIDMVILGTKGASNIEEYLIGTNAATMVENASCPVLVVPEKAVSRKIEKVLFITDFQSDNIPTLERLIELVLPFEAEIIVLHISYLRQTKFNQDDGVMEWFKNNIKKHIDYPRITYINEVRNKDNFNSINNFISENHIDLFSMCTRDKSFLKKIFTGNMSKKMIYHTDIPLLAFPMK
ncbi:MAG TPA: universal stress protein [Cytophagaceae bacterium]|jgi:nucleotide-binding universal stress UspA family protein|nr:universal stress protein [Cytophagaceae bacterium]